MLDHFDLNSVAKVRQINLQFIVTTHIKLQINFIFIIYHMIFVQQSS